MMAGFGLIWIVILIGAVFVGFHLLQRAGSGGPVPLERGGGAAEDILKQRYARGEIDREEYEQRLSDLRR